MQRLGWPGFWRDVCQSREAALAPMLSPEGRMKGDLTVFNWGMALVDHGFILFTGPAYALVQPICRNRS